MPKFYFTYGTDPAYPFQGGWTEIEAPDQNMAAELFRAVHPGKPRGQDILNCAAVYPEDDSKATKMFHNPLFGGYCHERIEFYREALSPESEFVIRCASKEKDMSVKVDGNISPVNLAVLIENLIEIGQSYFGPIFSELVQSVVNDDKFLGRRINFTMVQTDGGQHGDED